MKEIIISADGDSVVYSVPDDVANHLRKYCMKLTRLIIGNLEEHHGI